MSKVKIKNPVIVVMGVSGCGKTTIGYKLSKKLELPFYDADDFHPTENVEKMRKGVSLNDEDRLPWLKILGKKIDEWKKTKGAVLACSALKEHYRIILSSNEEDLKWVYLDGSYELVNTRIHQRKGHFMNPKLVMSQFNDLEIPKYGIHTSISQEPNEIVSEIITKLNSDG